MKLKKTLFISLILLLLFSTAAFANGIRELAPDETPVKVLNRSYIDGITNLLVVTESGSQILYRADVETVSTTPQDQIAIGDILAVKDNGIAAMSYPPQMWIDEFRVITDDYLSGRLSITFPEVEELLSPFFIDEVVYEEGYMWDVQMPDSLVEKFNYAYGYLNMNSFIEQGLVLYAGAFARGIVDAAASREALITSDEMNDAIDRYIDEIFPLGDQQTAGPQYYSFEEVSNLAIGESVEERFAYAYGYIITIQSLGQGIDIIPQLFAEGSMTAWYNATPIMSEDEMVTVFNEYRDMLNAQYEEMLDTLAEQNLLEAETFLSHNALEETMFVSEDGKIQFELVAIGDGAIPTYENTVLVNYQLKDMYNNLLDQGQNVEFPLSQLIPGFSAVVCELRVGDYAIAYIHPDYGYGVNGSGSVQPNQLLIFYIELLGIVE